MGRINESDYPVFKMSKVASHGKVGVKIDYEPRMLEYYRYIFNDDGRKVYFFSDSTMKRVENMDLSGLSTRDFLSICKKETVSTSGFVLTSENHRRLCFGYVIRPNHILISVYRGNRSSRHSDNPMSVAASMVIGNIIISESRLTINPSTTLTGILKVTSVSDIDGILDKDADADTVGKILSELKKVPDAFFDKDHPNDFAFHYMKLANDDRVPTAQREAKTYLYKYQVLQLALRMFVFLKTASVIQQTYISDEARVRTYNRSKKPIQNYVLVDSTWDGDITVLNPFGVKGHFRHQPKKDKNGEWYKELIYIDAFMKKGYHRRAKIVIEEKRT